MNPRILAFAAVAGVFLALQLGPWGPFDAAPSRAQASQALGVQTVTGTVRNVADVRAQFIVQRAHFPLDPRLRKPGMLNSIVAMQHPATAMLSNTWSVLDTPAAKDLRKALDLRSDGTPRRPIADLLRDRKTLAAIIQVFTKQRALGIVQRAATAKADARYRKVHGSKPRRAPMPAQAFDGVLRIFNDGQTPLTLWVDGHYELRTLDLTGPGAVSIFAGARFAGPLVHGRKVVIAAGRHVDMPVSSLEYGGRMLRAGAYATKPGRYSLAFGYRTHAVRQGAKPAHMMIRFPRVSFTVR